MRAVLNFEKPDDRLPVIEWAGWWNLTLDAWRAQGLDTSKDVFAQLGLDHHRQYWFAHKKAGCPGPKYHGGPIMENEEDYENLLQFLYPESSGDNAAEGMKNTKSGHDNGDFIEWFSMDGGFWFPRTLWGIENHFYAFYDYPELYHRILDDLAEFQLRQMEKIFAVSTPEFMTFGEDMSYNGGPMLSEDCFNEFLLPYYNKVIPFIKEHGTKVIIDSDGDITRMIPWLQRAGFDGALPLEHQAGCDIKLIRELFPDFIMLGAFDKMTMRTNGGSVEAMRNEFERILPVMKQGGFVPSVDHQTPPDCPLEWYLIYSEMLKEYGEKAVK